MVAESVEMAGRAWAVGRTTAWGSALLLAFALLTPFRAHAASTGEAMLDAAALVHLEEQAVAAQPREQCFLFSELVHELTEQAGREIAQGEEEQAQSTLKHAESVMVKMHVSVQQDAKRLKNAEMLLEHSSRRLSDMLHVAGESSRGAVQSTLQKLNALHTELLSQVFAK